MHMAHFHIAPPRHTMPVALDCGILFQPAWVLQSISALRHASGIMGRGKQTVVCQQNTVLTCVSILAKVHQHHAMPVAFWDEADQ